MKTKCRNGMCLMLLILAVPIVAPADETPAGAGQAQPALQTADPRYILRVGDAMEITFRFTPEYNQTVTVQPDGYINLKDLPDLKVAGKTTPQLAEVIRKAYAPILHDPVVSIHLRDFEKPYFIAGGEVGRPGKFEMRGDTTVVEAISIAGGFNEKSKHSQVLLFRRALRPVDGSEEARCEADAAGGESHRGPASSSGRHDLRAQEHALENPAFHPHVESRLLPEPH